MKSWPELDTKYFSYELFPVNLLLSYSINDNIITVKLRYSFDVLKNSYNDNKATSTKRHWFSEYTMNSTYFIDFFTVTYTSYL